MSGFPIPSFGYSNSSQPGFGSPKPYHSMPVYHPVPAVGTPSFGGVGRPMTPKESSRHSSYSSKEMEPTIQPIQPSVERVRRHRDYYHEGGDIYFLVSFLELSRRFADRALTSVSYRLKTTCSVCIGMKFRDPQRSKSVAGRRKLMTKTQVFLRARVARVQKTFCRQRSERPSPCWDIR